MSWHADMRVVWTGTDAAIPANWEADTDFIDVGATKGRYIQGGGAAFVGAANGGVDGHDHTDTVGHTHIGNSHSHPIAGAGLISGGATSGITSTGGLPQTNPPFRLAFHTHPSRASGFAIVVYNDENIEVDTDESDPESVKIIVIKPTLTGGESDAEGVPEDAVCFGNDQTQPANFEICDGVGGRPDLDGKHLKHVDTDGDDADLTGFGSQNHTHDQSAAGHNHGINTHDHDPVEMAFSGLAFPLAFGSGGPTLERTIHHQVSLNVNAAPMPMSSSDLPSDSKVNAPASKKLLCLQNTGGGGELDTPGIIVGWVGAIGNVPDDWQVVTDMYDLQTQITDNTLAIGNSVGSNTHDHAFASHGHTEGGGHNHVENVSFAGTTVAPAANGTPASRLNVPQHTHSSWSVGTIRPTLGNAVGSVDASDIRQLWRSMLFIKRRALDNAPFFGAHF